MVLIIHINQTSQLLLCNFMFQAMDVSFTIPNNFPSTVKFLNIQTPENCCNYPQI